MRHIFVLSLALAISGTGRGPAAQECTCQQDFEALATKIVETYPGYHLEDAARRRYDVVVDSLRSVAGRTGGEECVHVLRALTGMFGDPHLFILESPAVEDSVVRRLARTAEVVPLDEARIVARLRARLDALDPIEGIWYTKTMRVGVIRDTSHVGVFRAVYLGGADSLWTPGQVKAEFTRVNGDEYRGIVYAANHTPRHQPNTRIYRGTLLQLYGDTWGKHFPVPDSERGVLDPVDPMRPTIRFVGADASVVSIPSHGYEYRAVLDSLLERHHTELARRRVMIVDVRGDGGGSSLTTFGLKPYYETLDRRPPVGPSGSPVVLASPDNIRYFQRMSWAPKDLVERLQAAPGTMVPFSTEPERPPAPPDTTFPMPRRFAVLADGGVLSAGEAFILVALRSTRTTLFGQPTGGAIDYQNVGIVRLACRARGLLLGYPTIAATATLPKDGLNVTGILPDVPIGPEVVDPIAFVLGYYAGAGGISAGDRHLLAAMPLPFESASCLSGSPVV